MSDFVIQYTLRAADFWLGINTLNRPQIAFRCKFMQKSLPVLIKFPDIGSENIPTQ